MRTPTLTLIPEYPPRVRVEWLIASSRIVLAAGALLALAVSPADALSNWPLAYALVWYLLYSVLVLGAGVDPGAIRQGLGPGPARLRPRGLFPLQLLHRQRDQSVLRLLHLPGDLRHAALGEPRRGLDGHRHGGALCRHQPLHVVRARTAAVRPQHLPDPDRASRGGRRCWSATLAPTTTASSASWGGWSHGRGGCRGSRTSSPRNW